MINGSNPKRGTYQLEEGTDNRDLNKRKNILNSIKAEEC